MRTTLLTVALLAVTMAPAEAQQPLKLDFQNGLVTVEATGVPVRTILNEWGRLGGTKIVGADRIAGAPLTLKLVQVSEAKALETILRSVAGYMAAPRSVAGAGPSMYDRILVMATSSAPAPTTATRPTPGNGLNGAQRFMPRPLQREQPEEPEQEEPEEQDENPPNPPVFTFPQPGQQNGGASQPGQFTGAPGGVPGQNVNPTGNGAPQGIVINPATPGSRTGQPIGVPTPGMIVQPPQPQSLPPGMIKPPGGQR